MSLDLIDRLLSIRSRSKFGFKRDQFARVKVPSGYLERIGMLCTIDWSMVARK